MSACHPSGLSNDAYACLVLSAFEPNALPQRHNACLCIRVRFFALVRSEPYCALRLTVVMGRFCCFRLFGCGFLVGFLGGVFVVVFALWFGWPGCLPEPSHHPQ